MAPVRKASSSSGIPIPIIERVEGSKFLSWFKRLKRGKADGAKLGDNGMVTKMEFVLEDDHCYYVVYSKERGVSAVEHGSGGISDDDDVSVATDVI